MPVLFRRLLIFVLSSLPFFWIFYKTLTNQLGADPAKEIVWFTGNWAFYFLLITLAVTPLKRWVKFRNFHCRWLQVHRRMLGLFTLFYAVLHALAFWFFILGADASEFSRQIIERPYILVSLPAFILLIILGITSFKFMIKKMGSYWVPLHKAIYLIAILCWIHVFMQVRSSYTDAVIFGVLTFLLLLLRLFTRRST
jgi:methionine sulfoxide reductase heme-binding subunit